MGLGIIYDGPYATEALRSGGLTLAPDHPLILEGKVWPVAVTPGFPSAVDFGPAGVVSTAGLLPVPEGSVVEGGQVVVPAGSAGSAVGLGSGLAVLALVGVGAWLLWGRRRG